MKLFNLSTSFQSSQFKYHFFVLFFKSLSQDNVSALSRNYDQPKIVLGFCLFNYISPFTLPSLTNKNFKFHFVGYFLLMKFSEAPDYNKQRRLTFCKEQAAIMHLNSMLRLREGPKSFLSCHLQFRQIKTELKKVFSFFFGRPFDRATVSISVAHSIFSLAVSQHADLRHKINNFLYLLKCEFAAVRVSPLQCPILLGTKLIAKRSVNFCLFYQ